MSKMAIFWVVGEPKARGITNILTELVVILNLLITESDFYLKKRRSAERGDGRHKYISHSSQERTGNIRNSLRRRLQPSEHLTCMRMPDASSVSQDWKTYSTQSYVLHTNTTILAYWNSRFIELIILGGFGVES